MNQVNCVRVSADPGQIFNYSVVLDTFNTVDQEPAVTKKVAVNPTVYMKGLVIGKTNCGESKSKVAPNNQRPRLRMT